MIDDAPEARLARWTERDRAIGLVAEAEQLRATLAERDREVTDLRERCAQLGLRVTALEVERNRLAAQVAQAQRPSLARRLYRRARSVAARLPS